VQWHHAIWVTPEEIRALASAGTPVSFSPYTELRMASAFRRRRFPRGRRHGRLSVDTTALSGNSRHVAIMKAIQNIENGRSENEFKLPARRVRNSRRSRRALDGRGRPRGFAQGRKRPTSPW